MLELQGANEGSDASIELSKKITGAVLIPLVMMLYSSPFPVLQVIYKKKSTLGYAFLPYLLLWFNCFSWVIFAIHRGLGEMYEPFIVNSYGLCVNTVSLVIYGRNITDPAVRGQFRVQVTGGLMIISVLAVVSFIQPIHNCSDPNSYMCWW